MADPGLEPVHGLLPVRLGNPDAGEPRQTLQAENELTLGGNGFQPVLPRFIRAGGCVHP
ncbi:hypothetical protein [Microvirga guangxiensis]|uniref:hypothetical protein n=1 Tax=Microvirga guangxiensis TaxID=549386 RepID=UPI001FCDAD32|nr:hypothetical protein [Microvirga guangxiensis]